MNSTLFWLPLLLVIYTYFVYPLIVFSASKIFKKKYIIKSGYTPSVTFVISAYNEELVISEKIQNTLEIDYPSDKLDIIVVSDGSTDNTDRIVSSCEDISLFKTGGRLGKSEGLNMLFKENRVKSEIVVFSDANSLYNISSIKELVKYFYDNRIGLVCGELRYRSPDSDIGRGESAYWKYEKFIRKHEANLGRLVSPNGSIYAIRTELFRPVHPKAMSDFQMAEDVAVSGYDLVYEQNAYVHESTCIPVGEEFSRKVRIIAGCMIVVIRKIWKISLFRMFQMTSHKILRWLVPFFLVVTFGANLCLLSSKFYSILFAGQCLFYFSAFLGFMFYNSRINLFGIPLYFVVVNSASVVALFKFLTGRHKATWEIPSSTRETENQIKSDQDNNRNTQ